MDEIQQRDYNIRTILDRAWRLEQQGYRTTQVVVAGALLTAAASMVKVVEDLGFDVTASAAGFSWAPKPKVEEEAPCAT